MHFTQALAVAATVLTTASAFPHDQPAKRQLDGYGESPVLSSSSSAIKEAATSLSSASKNHEKPTHGKKIHPSGSGLSTGISSFPTAPYGTVPTGYPTGFPTGTAPSFAPKSTGLYLNGTATPRGPYGSLPSSAPQEAATTASVPEAYHIGKPLTSATGGTGYGSIPSGGLASASSVLESATKKAPGGPASATECAPAVTITATTTATVTAPAEAGSTIASSPSSAPYPVPYNGTLPIGTGTGTGLPLFGTGAPTGTGTGARKTHSSKSKSESEAATRAPSTTATLKPYY